MCCALLSLAHGHAQGLFKDKVPLYANYTTEQIRARKWRTSVFAPFAANVAFLLYKSAEEYYVRRMLPFMLPFMSEL